jgi:hypothetical protein
MCASTHKFVTKLCFCKLWVYVVLMHFSDLIFRRGPGSSVGITTGYGLDGPGSNSGGGEIFRTRPDRPWGPPSLLYNGYRVFPGDKAAGDGADHPPPPSAEGENE